MGSPEGELDYAQGYGDGESSANAAWLFALDDVLPDDMLSPTPTEVAAYIRYLQQSDD